MTDYAAVPPAASPPPLAPRPAAPLAAILLIALAVAGLATVGYFAWQRGYLDNLTGTRERESPVKVVAAPADDVGADADPLDRLRADVPGLKAYRGYADVLRAFDAALDEMRVETSAPGKLAESTRQQLYEMQTLGSAFVKDYHAFEQRAARDRQPKLQPYQELLRSAFLERMQRFVGITGDAYAAEQDFSHPVFTMSDTFIAAVEQYGHADPAPIRERWLAAVHAREQTGLSEQYEDEIKALQARIEALKRLHREVDALLKGAPEYRIRGGMLGNTARNLLEVFDSLAGRVEAQVLEFEEYVATLPAEHGSDSLTALSAEFTRLAQEDHFHAFRETYKIYEQDKELEHPAYARLKDHYEFVAQHWPTLKSQYQRQYEESEGRWAKKWAQ